MNKSEIRNQKSEINPNVKNSKFKIISFFRQKGQSLVELILVMGLAAIILPALITGLIASREGKVQQQQRTQAVYLLKETVEATRSIREKGWAGFAVNGTYHPEISGDQWIFVSGQITENGFTKQVVISDLQRDSSGAIVVSGGTSDPSSKKVDISISWNLPYSSNISTTLYMTKYLENNALIHTTIADFTPGTLDSTAIPNPPSGDGEVTLGAGGGGGDWCQPDYSIVEVDLPKSGVANAIYAIEGTVFAGTGDNSSGVSFAKVPLSGDPPESAVVEATFDGYKTNAVFGEDIEATGEKYAYLATDNNSKEVVIIDLNQYSAPGKYLEIGYINVAGNGDGESIYVSGDKAYVLANSKLYIYNVSTRSGAHSTELNTGGLTISGAGKKIMVGAASNGNTYAYIATGVNSNQFQIVNVTNPASPAIIGQRTLGSSQAGVDMFVNVANPDHDRAYFVTSYSSGRQNFFILNISDRSNPVIVGNGYNTSEMSPKGLTVVTGNKAIIVGTGGTNQYQVVDIANETNPASCAGLQYATGVNGVSSVLQENGRAYSYTITGDAGNELKIVLGGGSGSGGSYTDGGTYTSAAFNAGSSTTFNRFDPVFIEPSQTSITFQVAVANAVSGSCAAASYSFIGPDLTGSTYFASGSAVPLSGSGDYQNPGQCFKYKVDYNSNDSTQTPVLESMTVNYSP